MTRQQLLDRLMSMRDAGENMDLPLIVRIDGEDGSTKRPVHGELKHCTGGSYGLGKGGVWSGLLIAYKVKP